MFIFASRFAGTHHCCGSGGSVGLEADGSDVEKEGAQNEPGNRGRKGDFDLG